MTKGALLLDKGRMSVTRYDAEGSFSTGSCCAAVLHKGALCIIA